MIMNWMIPAVTGPETHPNWVPAFVIGALLVPLALLCVWLLARKVEPVTPRRP